MGQAVKIIPWDVIEIRLIVREKRQRRSAQAGEAGPWRPDNQRDLGLPMKVSEPVDRKPISQYFIGLPEFPKEAPFDPFDDGSFSQTLKRPNHAKD